MKPWLELDLRTAGGDVVFWSDADQSGAGHIQLSSTNTICSGWNVAASTCSLSVGGDIVMGGGAVDLFDSGLPAGAAQGSGTAAPATVGLALGPCVSNVLTNMNNVFTTRGGNMILRGAGTTGNPTTVIKSGVAICFGTTINIGSGKIDISSQIRSTSATYPSAFWAGPWVGTTTNGVVINSTNSASDALDLRAWGSTADYTSNGFVFNNTAAGGAVFEIDTIWDNANADFNFNSSGSMKVIPANTSFSTSMTLGSNFTISNSASSFEVGTPSNSGTINITGTKQIAGDIVLRGGTVSISAAVTTTGSGKKIGISADTFTVSANISATNSSRLEIAQRTPGRGIVLGAASNSALALPSAGANFLRATTLQFGNEATGDVSVAASTTFASANVTNLKDRHAGFRNCCHGCSSICSLTLAIDAGGGVNLPGSNSVAGNLAISASGSVTYSSAVSYSPAVVDGTNAVFGVGRAISLTNSPTLEQANEFLAVTFNPPPQVLIADAYNKVLDGNNRLAYQYTASAQVVSGSGTVTGLTSSSRVGGNISFNAIKVMTGTGIYNFNLTIETPSASFTVASGDYNIMAGEPGRLIVTASDAVSVVAQSGFSFAVGVEDIAGNRITIGDNKNITVSASISGTTATIISGGQVRADDDGVATFSDLVITGSVSDTISVSFTVTYQRLSDNQTVTVTSSATAITLTHGAATQITMTNSATARNGIAFTTQPVVRILDAYGNLVSTGAQSTQTVKLSVTPNALTGTTDISASGGIATFSGIAIEGSTGSKTVTARIYSPVTISDLAIVELGVGNATKLTLETTGLGAASGFVLTTQPVLKLRDSSNNLVTGVAHNVVATINPAASLSGTTIAVNTTTGTATFTALSISGTVGSYSISFAIEGASSSAVASVSQAIELTHGAAVAVKVVSQPSSAIAGVTLSPVVFEMVDARGNRVTTGDGSTKSVSIYTYLNASTLVGAKNLSMAAGLVTFDNLAATNGGNGNIKIGITAGGYGVYTSNIFLGAAAPSYIEIALGQPVNQVAGTSQATDVSLRLKDAYGNFSSNSSTVSVLAQAVSSSDTTSVQKTFGTFTFSPDVSLITITRTNFVINNSGSYKMKFSATGIDAALSNTFQIRNAQAHSMVVLQNMPSAVQSGLTFSPVLTLEIRDSFGNPVIDSTTSISISAIVGSITSITGGVAVKASGSSIVEFPDLAIAGAVGNAQLRFTASQSGAVINAKTLNSSAFSISSGVPYKLSVSPSVLSVANRIGLGDVVVKVLDRSGNVVPDSMAQVSAALSGATLSGTQIVYAAGGIASFSSLAISGTVGSYELGFSSTDLVSATVSITLTHGAAHSVDFSAPAATRNALSVSEMVAKILDRDGNLVTTGNQSTQSIALSISDAGLSGTRTLAASGGIATFSNVVATGLVGSKTISAAISLPYAISASSAIEITYGNAYELDLTTQASGFAAGELFTQTPVVTVLDITGNEVPSTGMAIRLSVSTATLSGSVTASAATGVATFASDLRLRGVSGNHIFVFTAEGTSSSGVISTSQAIVLNHGLPNRLNIAQHSNTARVGINFTQQPVVQILDLDGNVVSDSSLVVSISTNGADLSGSTSRSAVAGIANFSGVKLSGSVSSAVTVSYAITSGGSQITKSTQVQLLAGSAASASLSWTATNVQTRVAPQNTPLIELFDEFGNKVVSDNASTAVAKLYRSGTLITESALTFTANGGEIQFSSLALRAEPRAGYYYQFEVVGLSAVSSSDFVVLPGPVAKVVINQQPSAGIAPNLTRTGNASGHPADHSPSGPGRQPGYH